MRTHIKVRELILLKIKLYKLEKQIIKTRMLSIMRIVQNVRGPSV